jgi:3-phytase
MGRTVKPAAALPGAIALLLLSGCASWFLPYQLQHVPADAETTPMAGAGDVADDPALWVHPGNPALSLILGTNKEEGLFIYDLAGRDHEHLELGRVNNVDVRGDLAVASNDQVNGLSWVRITATEQGAVIRHIGDTMVRRYEPYGVCLGILDERPVAGVTYPDGTIELWRATDHGERITAELARTETFASQLEGCVFDDAEQRLFIGEEDHGVWSLDLSDPASRPSEVDTIAAGKGLVEDVEGMSLYKLDNGAGYLVVSAQGADRFILYERQPPHRVVGAIRIASSRDGRVDGVSHTDGLEASSAPLPQYPRGLLIVQDDANPWIEKDQNFKLVDWRSIESAINLPSR